MICGVDREKLIEATDCCRDLISVDDIDKIISKPHNIMFMSGRDVGLCIFDYPGVYTVHWYYPDARGRKALDLGREMTNLLFEEHGAKTLRALVRKSLKASRWAARQIGFKSLGFIVFPGDDENEILYKTEEMYKNEKE